MTTTCGLRSAFIHVDGDGSSNYTTDVGTKPQPCTKVLREQILEVYEFPASVSAIAYCMTEQGAQRQEFITEFQKIMGFVAYSGGITYLFSSDDLEERNSWL